MEEHTNEAGEPSKGHQNGEQTTEERMASSDQDEEVQSEAAAAEPDTEPPTRTSARLATRNGRNMEEQLRARALKDSFNARNWRQFEKNQLYNGLRQYGSKKWRKVSELVHTKSDPVVKAYINRERRNQNYIIQTTFQKLDGTEVLIDDGGESKKPGRPAASNYFNEEREDGSIKPEGKVVEKLVRRNRDAPCERWLEVIQNHDSQSAVRQKAAGNPEPLNYSSVLPTSLNWIAENEKHPDPSSSGNVDYAEIYRYLACISEGEAPPELNMETARRVSQLLPDLAKVVKRMDFGKESKFLENYRGLHTANTYRSDVTYDPRTKSAQNVLAMSAIPGLNPLGLHPEVAVDRIVPFKDDKTEIPEQ